MKNSLPGFGTLLLTAVLLGTASSCSTDVPTGGACAWPDQPFTCTDFPTTATGSVETGCTSTGGQFYVLGCTSGGAPALGTCTIQGQGQAIGPLAITYYFTGIGKPVDQLRTECLARNDPAHGVTATWASFGG